MRINKKVTGMLIFIFIGAAVSFFTIDQMRPRPYHEKKLDMILTLASKDIKETKQAEQIRNFGKELYMPAIGSNARRKTELHYLKSILTLNKGIYKSSMNEIIQHMVLIREDEISQSDKEGIYTVMEADVASILFETGEIIADNVLLRKIKNFSFPKSPFDQGLFFYGTATKVQANLIGKKEFVAHDLKGRFLHDVKP